MAPTAILRSTLALDGRLLSLRAQNQFASTQLGGISRMRIDATVVELQQLETHRVSANRAASLKLL